MVSLPCGVPQEEGECEVELELELEGEVEGECEVEEAYEEEREEAEDYPAVIVEEVPSASLAEEQSYSAQVLVYGDEAYIMQEVGDEQEVETNGDPGETETLCRSLCFEVSCTRSSHFK